jgi:hypothetical protein|eukprot:38974-Prymnesium_polylepis.2
MPKHRRTVATHAEKVELKRIKREERKAMSTVERAAIGEQRRKSKAGMVAAQCLADTGDFECIKCGLNTNKSWCPDCGRPAY